MASLAAAEDRAAVSGAGDVLTVGCHEDPDDRAGTCGILDGRVYGTVRSQPRLRAHAVTAVRSPAYSRLAQ